jgi:hypothetical protein
MVALVFNRQLTAQQHSERVAVALLAIHAGHYLVRAVMAAAVLGLKVLELLEGQVQLTQAAALVLLLLHPHKVTVVKVALVL